MTIEGGALALVDEESPGDHLLEWEEAFAREYHAGEHAGNATKSMLKCRPEYSYDRASAEASVLLRKGKVARFLGRLREESLKQFRKGIIALVPKALSILDEALKSESWSLRKWATEIVLDRGLGKPVQPVEQDIGSRLDNLIREIAARKRSGGHGDLRPNPERPLELPGSQVEVVGRVSPGTPQETPISMESPVAEAEVIEQHGEQDNEGRSEERSWRHR